MSILLNGLETALGKDRLIAGSKAYVANGVPRASRNGILDRGVIWNGNRFLPPQPGCVLYLPGLPAQGSSIKDYSGNGNHGAITGATWVRLSSGLPALNFDAVDDNITIPSSASVNMGSSDFSLKFWFKTTSVATGKYFLSKGDAAANWYAVGWGTIGAGKLSGRIGLAGVIANFESASGQNDGAWRQAILTFDRDGLGTVYINGAVSGTPVDISTTAGDIDNNFPLYSGLYQAEVGFALARSMVLHQIVKRLVSASEAPVLFNQERSLFGI